jgi:hypothetical protein
MRWINHCEALVSAFAAPDAQPLAFRLPGHLGQDRVHLLARQAFGYRANVAQQDGSWVVTRREYLDARARNRREKDSRRQEQRRESSRSRKQLRPVALRGGL